MSCSPIVRLTSSVRDHVLHIGTMKRKTVLLLLLFLLITSMYSNYTMSPVTKTFILRLPRKFMNLADVVEVTKDNVVNVAKFGEKQIEERKREDKMKLEKELENVAKLQKCIIPDLNPFDPEITPYLKPPYIEGCSLKKYGVIKGETLHLNVKNVIYAVGAYVERNGDFAVQFAGHFNLLGSRSSSTSKNYLQECWSNCGYMGGKCPGFCGVGGFCCRKGFPNCSQNVIEMTSDQHTCVHHNVLEIAEDIDIAYPLKKEFSQIRLWFKVNNTVSHHEEYHFIFKEKVEAETATKHGSSDILSGLNIVMVLFDSVSHAHAARSMQKTYKYLKEHPRTVIMKGQSIVGDGTTGQLCAFLTGVPEKDLPEARRGFRNAAPVDGWPWIFKDLHRHKYITMYSEEDQGVGTFHMRLHGFVNPPTKHYVRPLWLAQYFKNLLPSGISCPHQFNFDYLNKFLDAYKSESKFGMVFNGIVHGAVDRLENTDADTWNFYRGLEDSEHYKNTVVILMGDHGLRTSTFRSTLHGKLEERLPLLSITLPPVFDAYPEAVKNLRQNSNLMTSHFDLHSTLHHLITFPYLNEGVKNKYGKSLFTDISQLNRTCAEAGVDAHWCACLNYAAVDPEKDQIVRNFSTKVIDFINTRNSQTANGLCAKLTLRKIISAHRSTPNEQVNQFTGTQTIGGQCDSCHVNYDKNKKFTRFRYQINFSVNPSNGEYEAEADITQGKDEKIINLDKTISRTNLYGDQPACIAKTHPHLRPYCYCLHKSRL